MNHSFMRKIREFEVQDTLKMMKLKKVTGPNRIPINMWIYQRGGIRWLANLFNRIWQTKNVK